MGLDMYAYAVEKKQNGQLDTAKIEDRDELAYWRKHNALHGWMENHWHTLNYHDYLFQSEIDSISLSEEKFEEMQQDDFNCVPLPLPRETLDKLEQDIKDKKLVPVGGFFFGATDYDPAEEAEEDLKFIAKAKEAIEAGKVVFYNSWW